MEPSKNSNEVRANFLSRTAREVRNYKVMKRMALLIVGMLVLLVGTVYTVAALYNKSGSFTVSVDKVEMSRYGLTLSESKELTHMSSMLNAKSSESFTNIAGEDLPDNIDSIDGEHNGRNHIAYTFYLQNAGGVEVAYEYSITVKNVTNGLDEAIRVRLYTDGEPVTYAKTRRDGGGAEPGTVEFFSQDVAARGRNEAFAPGAVTKFTVAVWIEGNDPDCLDLIIGGKIKLDMDISVIH